MSSSIEDPTDDQTSPRRAEGFRVVAYPASRGSAAAY